MSSLTDYKSKEREGKINIIALSIQRVWDSFPEEIKLPEKEKIIEEACIQFGVTKRKAKEYLDIALKMIGGVVDKDGLIYKSKDFTNSERILRASGDLNSEEIKRKAEEMREKQISQNE